MNRKKTLKVDIELNRSSGVVELWDLDDGIGYKIDTHSSNSRLYVYNLELTPSQALCFRITARTDFTAEKEETEVKNSGLTLSGSCRYSLGEKNICVLDRPKWNLMDSGFKGPMEILQIDRRVRKKLNIPLRAGEMVQPWFRAKESFASLGSLQLQYDLNIAAGALSSLKTAELVLETPERFNLTINGREIDLSRDKGFWTDIAFRRIALPEDIFIEGKNRLVLSCDFHEDINLEALYLIGDFAVDARRKDLRIYPLPEKVKQSDLVNQGFPFYSGSFFYHYEIPQSLQGQDVFVKIPSYTGAFAKLHSGTHSEMLPWLPAEGKISLDSQLSVEVSVTRKNTFGPLYNPLSNMGNVGPDHFVMNLTRRQYRKPYFIKSGLLKPIEIKGG